MRTKRHLKLALVALLLLTLTGCGAVRSEAPDKAQTTEAATSEATGSDLVIPIAGITQDASFYAAEADGVQMEVIAVKASDGTIRTAFNTCQICYGSGQAYYVQQDSELICQNCSNRFSMDQVEVESGGCNPWPIFAENKTVDGENITIPYAFLRESAALFENWKSVQY